MILHLKNLSSRPLDPKELTALGNLATCSNQGYHVVSGDRPSLDFASEIDSLSESARKTYARLSLELTQNWSFLATQPRLIVSPRPTGSEVPLGRFVDFETCQQTQLLTEDLTDAEVVLELAKARLRSSTSAFTLRARSLNGGGGSIARGLKRAARQLQAPLVCIVDSDRKFPHDAVGSTALTCGREAASVSNSGLFRYFVIEAREIENILPIELLKECAKVLEREKQEELAQAILEDRNFLDFASHKHGDSLCQMRDRANVKANDLGMAALLKVSPKVRGSARRCNHCGSHTECITFPALGHKLLDRVAEILSDAAFASDTESWHSILKSLTGVVSEAALASHPVRL